MSKSMPDITWPDIQRGRVVTAAVECPRCGETALIDGGAFTSGTGSCDECGAVWTMEVVWSDEDE